MSYFQAQCPRCGQTYTHLFVGSTLHSGHVCPIAVPHGCATDSFSSRVCERGTKCCVVTHPPEEAE